MKEDVHMVYYTESDCFWIDQVARWLSGVIIIIRLSNTVICRNKTPLLVPE